MACLGVHFALTPEQEQELLAARGSDAAVLEVVQEKIEHAWDREWLCETDKAWDAIHRCLTDGTLNLSGGSRPLNLAVFGGEQLYVGGDYYVCFVSRNHVPAVAEALAGFDRTRFQNAYENLAQTNYDGPIGEDDREYTWEYLQGLTAFFAKAATAGRSVVFSVDQ